MMWPSLRPMSASRSGRHDVTQPSREADPFAVMRERLDQMFDDMIGATTWRPGTEVTPRVDVAEQDGALQVSAELPGVEPDGVEITLHDNILTIKGEKKTAHSEDKGAWHVAERRYGAFTRSVMLPFEADPDQVQARFDKGVLTVSVPKPPETEAKTKRIAIKQV